MPAAVDAVKTKGVLSGKQEHYLKRELVSQQVKWEIAELSSPTALQRFGAPFKSDRGEVAPVDSELPILRYLFVNHVRNFPFLDQAKEKEFWQDKLQTFLESFAVKRISSSEDRLEETKRRKLSLKAQKLVELMMVSGIPTASGYEERIRFEEIEVVDRGAMEAGLLVNVPEGHWVNGWDVNVCGVRQVNIKRHIKTHAHAEFLIRTKTEGQPDVVVGRRYGEFAKLHHDLRHEFPGKVFPNVPRKETSSQIVPPAIISGSVSTKGDDSVSVSSFDSSSTSSGEPENRPRSASLRPPSPEPKGRPRSHSSSHSRSHSRSNSTSQSRPPSRSGIFGFASRLTGGSSAPSVNGKVDGSTSSSSIDSIPETPAVLWRETQRISLRAFLRALLADTQIANSKSMRAFLLHDPITLKREEVADEMKRRDMDTLRVQEQRRFYEVARQRARELDVYMESFRRDIVETNGLTKLFAAIRKADRLDDLSENYKKFAEWLRIEVAATIYHIFLAEDNSPELFAQLKQVHSLIPYYWLKNIIRITNPAMVMSGVLDLFLAAPFGSRSLMQRILGMALNDGLKQFQRAIDSAVAKVDDQGICEKIKGFVDAEEEIRNEIKSEAEVDGVDLVVAILRSESLKPELTPSQIEKVFNGWVAWNIAVEHVDEEMKNGAVFYAHLKQLLKLYTRQRDKSMMLNIIQEPVTLQLFRDLFMIFYEPLIRVYKSANVYNSVTDFSDFITDLIQVVEKAQSQAMAADPNQTVQAFIDLCARHEDNFYKFVHEVHLHDNGLFEKLMGWLEGILQFLRNGPGKSLDVNELFRQAVSSGKVDEEAARREIDSLIKWQAARKRWHESKTRQKMAGDGWAATGPENVFKSSDFGLDQDDLEDLAYVDDEFDEAEADAEEEDADMLGAERKRRSKMQEALRGRAGEPQKPEIKELGKMGTEFVGMLRQVLA